MLRRKQTPQIEQTMPTLIQWAKADAEEWNKLQRWVCAEICKHYEEVSSAYPESNSPCDTCKLNIKVSKRMEDAELLGVVRSETGERRY